MDPAVNASLSLLNRLFKHLIALLSALAAIVALATVLTSTTMKSAVRSHSSWVYAGLVIGFMTAFLAVDYALTQNRKYRALMATVKQASDHDEQLLQIILSLLPVDGEIMIWVRNRFFVKRMPVRLVDAIRDIEEQLSLRPVGFDNMHVSDAYKALLMAMQSFDEAVSTWAVAERRSDGRDNEMLAVPLDMKESEGGEKRYYDALKEIDRTVSSLVGRYDDFLMVCRQNGLAIYQQNEGSVTSA